MDKDIILKKLEEFYNNMTDDQLKAHLEKSGLSIIEDDKGDILLEEEYDEFQLPNPIQIRFKSKYNFEEVSQRKGYDLFELRKVV